MVYYIFTPLVLKWLNLNHFPSLCDFHSLSIPITVKRFSVLITSGCFPTTNKSSLYHHTRVKLIFLKFFCVFFSGGGGGGGTFCLIILTWVTYRKVQTEKYDMKAIDCVVESVSADVRRALLIIVTHSIKLEKWNRKHCRWVDKWGMLQSEMCSSATRQESQGVIWVKSHEQPHHFPIGSPGGLIDKIVLSVIWKWIK